MTGPTTPDQYIEQFDGEVKARLLQLRQLVREEVPEANEGIMYGLIGYKYHKTPLVYFGGFAQHIGFYATPQAHESFTEELAQYKQGKGSVQFPLSKPLPLELVRRMVRHKKQQLEEKS